MLNENLKTIRKEKGFTQEILAMRLNVVRQTVSKWEKGISVPDAEMLQKIAEVLDVDTSVLLGAEHPIEKEERTDIATELAKINEYLAKKAKKARIIKKVVIYVVSIILLTLFTLQALYVMESPLYPMFREEKNEMLYRGSFTISCNLRETEHIIKFEYSSYEGGDFIWLCQEFVDDEPNDYFDNRFPIEDYLDYDDNVQMEVYLADIYDYIIDRGGSVELIEVTGVPDIPNVFEPNSEIKKKADEYWEKHVEKVKEEYKKNPPTENEK